MTAAVPLLTLLERAGFKGDALRTAWAVAMRESGGNPQAFNGNASTGDKSYGLFQINMLGGLGPARLKQYGLQSNAQLLDPVTNARVAFLMSHGGQDWGAWAIGPNAYPGAPPAAHAAFERYYAQFPGAKQVAVPLGGTATDPYGKGPGAAGGSGAGGSGGALVPGRVVSTPTVAKTPGRPQIPQGLLDYLLAANQTQAQPLTLPAPVAVPQLADVTPQLDLSQPLQALAIAQR